MFIALIPFSTSILGEYWNQHISVIIYGVSLLVALSWTCLQWWCVTKDRLVDIDLNPTLIKMVSRRFRVAPIAYLIAIDVSFISIEASLVFYIATPLYYLLPAQRKTRPRYRQMSLEDLAVQKP